MSKNQIEIASARVLTILGVILVGAAVLNSVKTGRATNFFFFVAGFCAGVSFVAGLYLIITRERKKKDQLTACHTP